MRVCAQSLLTALIRGLDSGRRGVFAGGGLASLAVVGGANGSGLGGTLAAQETALFGTRLVRTGPLP